MNNIKRASSIKKGMMVEGQTVTAVVNHPSGIALLGFGGKPIVTGLKPNNLVMVD